MLSKKRSPQNKAICDQNKLLFATLAPTITNVLWSGLCLLVSGWFVTDKILGCCDETSKPSASDSLESQWHGQQMMAPASAWPAGSKVLRPIWPALSYCLNLSTWKLHGYVAVLLPFGPPSDAAAAALPCFLSFKLILSALNRNPVWLFVFLTSTWLLEMGEGEEWNQNYQLGLQE